MDIKKIQQKAQKELAQAHASEEVRTIWKSYLGPKGEISVALKELKNLPEQDRKKKGPELQELKKAVQHLCDAKGDELASQKQDGELKKEAENLNYGSSKIGHLHPITQTIRQLNTFFKREGYSIMDGPEIEQDEYCFQRLNVPLNHPARDMQDTVYIKEPDMLLRTQTSSIEARVLASHKPPLKFVSPGRVYRNEKVNKSNHFIFHHYQGVVVGEGVTLKDLFGTFTALFKEMYGPDVVIRFRNKYYPEVEPGVGPDMRCFQCEGKGCQLCKFVGWIEMGGAGIIHPKVMESAGLDITTWRGFAFGLGLDRWVMAKYNITDIRTLLGGNLAYRYYDHESSL